MTELKTDYKEDILETSQQGKRTFNIVSKTGEILFEDVHIEDVSKYTQVGDEYGQAIINAQNEAINKVAKGSGLVFDTYQDYLDAKAKGEVAVGNVIYIKEGNQSEITALQVVYNNSNVKLALDTHGEKISEINEDISQINTNKEYKPSSRVINAQTDLLRVILGNNDHIINQPYYFSTDYGALTNLPPNVPSVFYGWREVKCVMSLTTVILHEMFPNYGRKWLNTYDTNANAWYGWRHTTAPSA